METLVMKYGGASMRTVSQFKNIASIIKKRKEIFSKIVVVVSAMGTMTNDLMQLSKMIHPNPPKREQDMLISIGERISISLLAMALDLQGIKVVSFTGSQSGIITTSDHGEAKIIEVRPKRVRAALEEDKVVIVAGFQGVSVDGEITTLGRNGSDISAVALAGALSGKYVEFYKDVFGIGVRNPKEDPETKIFKELTYEEALEKGGLHKECIQVAKEHGIELHIRHFLYPEKPGTRIGAALAI